MNVAIIGAGAGGVFSAIHVKENYPSANVSIFEKTGKALQKVKISGGGRCNVTNACTEIIQLSKSYPRGEKFLKKAFYHFNAKDTMDWFEKKEIPLVIQKDNCVFPKSQKSQTIIDCFLNELERLKIEIIYNARILEIEENENELTLHFSKQSSQTYDKVIVATGGSPKRKGLNWLENLGHEIIEPIPSLFTFNMPKESITELMGIVVEKAMVRIQGTKLNSQGPLLITHWGMSGPVILKLSAFGARLLSETNYEFNIQVNWISIVNNDDVKKIIEKTIDENAKKQLQKVKLFSIPTRLWNYLLLKCDLPLDKKWSELGKKGIYKLVNVLTNDIYSINGKTTFKEEFVTCGGISLSNIDVKTMQSRIIKNLYFTGEVMDIDGITGGFNFQAAWTTAYIAAKLK